MEIPGYLYKMVEKVKELPASAIKNDLAALVTIAINDKFYCLEKERDHETSKEPNGD
jgi:hypothetical protein